MLKRYKEYKKANTSWLHSIPNNWVSSKIGELFEERRVKVSDKEYAPLTVGKMGVVPQLSTVAKSNDGDNRKLVKSGDFVINSRSDRKGSSGLSSYDGSVSLINIVLTPRKGNGKYYHYLLRSHYWIEEYYRNGRGIVADLWTTRFSEMKSIVLPVPPCSEQDQIVRYLDWKVSMINKYINAKKKQIELLREQKQAIINQAVTKGLDPKAPVKDSGIEWLGKIPAHWEIRRIGAVYEIELGKMLQPNINNSNDTKEKYLCAINIFWDRIDVDNLKEMWFSEEDKKKYYISKNDLIVVEGGDVAVCCIWEGQIDNCYIQNALHRVRSEYNNAFFLRYWLMALKNLGYIDAICNKATFAHFTKEKFSNLFIFLPLPNEQQAIVNYIETKITVIDKAITNIQQEIDLLTEYRTRLISDVVTGRVDVRGKVA